MKEIPVKKKAQLSENGTEHTYSYYIIADEVETDGVFCESYGVKLVCDNNEIANIPNITANLKRIVALVLLLGKNTVSPCNASDVILDML
jgi:hypothetical protein